MSNQFSHVLKPLGPRPLGLWGQATGPRTGPIWAYMGLRWAHVVIANKILVILRSNGKTSLELVIRIISWSRLQACKQGQDIQISSVCKLI